MSSLDLVCTFKYHSTNKFTIKTLYFHAFEVEYLHHTDETISSKVFTYSQTYDISLLCCECQSKPSILSIFQGLYHSILACCIVNVEFLHEVHYCSFRIHRIKSSVLKVESIHAPKSHTRMSADIEYSSVFILQKYFIIKKEIALFCYKIRL